LETFDLKDHDIISFIFKIRLSRTCANNREHSEESLRKT